MDSIFEMEKEISLKYNHTIENLSYWNPSKQYMDLMQQALVPQSINHLFNYVYTYDIPITTRKEVVKKILGRYDDTQMCMFLPNSTLSILNVINYLKLHGYNKIHILQPSYFSVEEACSALNMPTINIPLEYKNGEYNMNIDISNINSKEALWITSPIYSTNCLPSQEMVKFINELTYHNIPVIVDESLNINGYEILRKLNLNRSLFSIYSPHKSLFLNGFKFSAIICDKQNDDFLEQWVDVLGGALPASSVKAIEHFLMPNFDLCKDQATMWFYQNKRMIIEIIQRYPFAQIDTVNSIGSYLTVNIPNLPFDSLEFMKELIEQTFISFIPGFLNGNPNCSFRINLSLHQNTIVNGLNSILAFISQHIF